jgi:aspartate aminotransferase/aminotransferase
MTRAPGRRAGELGASGIAEMMRLAAQTPGAIRLEVGEPDQPTPPYIVAAAFEAARDGFTRYTPAPGLPSLREALARKITERNGLPTTPEQVIATSGSVFALSAAMLAALDPGDEALVPDPGWPNYWSALHLVGARAVGYPLVREAGYEPDLDALRRLVGPRTRVLVMNSPSNPTGAVFSPSTVRALVELAAERDLTVISDEVYEEFVYEGEHRSPAAFDRDGRVITIYGFSKTYAMTGWRLGYARATPPVAAAMARIAEAMTGCPPSVAQKAAEAALAGPRTEVDAMRARYRRHRDLAAATLGEAGLLAAVPRGAFYALVDLARVEEDSMTLARRLLYEQGVATAPGETFGPRARGMVRISLATEGAQLEEGCRRIIRFAQGGADGGAAGGR